MCHRRKKNGGVLLEAILGLALLGLLIQMVSVSGMSAFQASAMRESRAQALDLCIESLSKIKNNPKAWVSSGTVTQEVKRHGHIFKVVQKASEVSNDRLHTEVIVTWKTGPLERTIRRSRDFLLEVQ